MAIPSILDLTINADSRDALILTTISDLLSGLIIEKTEEEEEYSFTTDLSFALNNLGPVQQERIIRKIEEAFKYSGYICRISGFQISLSWKIRSTRGILIANSGSSGAPSIDIVRIDNEIRVINETIEDLETQIVVLEEELTQAIEDGIDSLRTEIEEQITALQEQITALEEQIAPLLERLDDIEEYLQNLRLEITGVVLEKTNWNLISGNYQYVYSNVAIKDTSRVDVVPSNVSYDIVSAALFYPKTTSTEGTVTLTAKNLPSDDIIVDLLIIN